MRQPLYTLEEPLCWRKEHKKRAVGIFWVQEEERERLRRTLKAGLLLFFWSLISCSSNKMTPNSMSGAHARARTHTHRAANGNSTVQGMGKLIVVCWSIKSSAFTKPEASLSCLHGPCLLPVEFSQHAYSWSSILILSCNWDFSTKVCKRLSSPPPRMPHLALISYLLI